MKKFASLVGAGAMLLGMAIPTFAMDCKMFPWMCPTPKPKPVITKAVVNNYADVDTILNTTVNTGWNMTSGWFGGSIFTGAGSVLQTVTDNVNMNVIGCDCYDNLRVKNGADVDTILNTSVNTGWNNAGGFGLIGSGAGSAINMVDHTVNTNIIGGSIN